MIKIPIYVTYGGNPRPKGFKSRKQGTAFLIDLAHYIEEKRSQITKVKCLTASLTKLAEPTHRGLVS